MKECEICGRTEELLETIIDGKPANACKECALMNNAVILTKPSQEKLKKVERIFSVRERLEDASKIKEKEKMQKIKEMEKEQAFPDTISYRLRKVRERAGLSKEKLADSLGLKLEDINKIESGEEPSKQVLKKYSQFFKEEFRLNEELPEDSEINFRDEKVTLKDLFARAKTFFTGKPDEKTETAESEVDVINEKEKDLKARSKEKIRIEE